MTSSLTVERLGRCAIITLNQSPANLLTTESLLELVSCLADLRAVGDVSAVVLTGAGDAFFSAGASLVTLQDGDRQEGARIVDALVAAGDALRTFPGVTVAAVNGYALGAGLECALSCHYIVAEHGAMLGMPQARVGLLPAAGGIRQLVDKVGLAWTRRMVLGGENVDATTARQIGLIEEVVEPGFAKIMAVSLADRVARQGPQAVRLASALIDSCLEQDWSEHLAAARRAFLQVLGSEEQREGVAAFLSKRAPAWCDDDDEPL
jgi:enoyl-CoA hydratase/carnithine racemase